MLLYLLVASVILYNCLQLNSALHIMLVMSVTLNAVLLSCKVCPRCWRKCEDPIVISSADVTKTVGDQCAGLPHVGHRDVAAHCDVAASRDVSAHRDVADGLARVALDHRGLAALGQQRMAPPRTQHIVPMARPAHSARDELMYVANVVPGRPARQGNVRFESIDL